MTINNLEIYENNMTPKSYEIYEYVFENGWCNSYLYAHAS
jgi:hypothetical protein